MERSLRTFLDFTRPPAAERAPTDLVPLIAGVADLLRGRAERQKVGVALDLPAGGVVVTADAEQLRQVLVNLGLNALDAMPSGGALRLGLRRWAGGPVEVEVSDTGPGIAPTMMARRPSYSWCRCTRLSRARARSCVSLAPAPRCT